MILGRITLFDGPGTAFRIMDLPSLPEPGPGECLVRIRLATLCGSDLHTRAGRRHGPVPCILGHEAVGEVVAAGAGFDRSLMGRRVTWTLTDQCGVCAPCSQWGLPQKCERLFKYGHAAHADGSGLNGCYATHILLRSGTTVVPVPDSVPDAAAASANCALATMVAVRRTLPPPGNLAVIQGAGLLGLYGCALLRSAGWPRVVVVDPQPDRLAWVGEMGGIPSTTSATHLVPHGSADVVIEVCGHSSVIPEGLQMLRPGGHYAWAGMVHPHSLVDLTGEAVIRGCITIRGSHNYTPADLHEAIRFLEVHGTKMPWDRMVSAPFALEALDQAFALAESSKWLRVSIDPRLPPPN
jgi:putative phosphonate catabolism associated alcohol dehydrogenase